MASTSKATTGTLNIQDAADKNSIAKLNLSVLPPIYILPTHIDDEHRHDLEDHAMEAGAPLTYDISEARIVVGNVGTKRRAELELRVRKLWTEPVDFDDVELLDTERSAKRMRVGSRLTYNENNEHFIAELSRLKADDVYLLRLDWLEQVLNGQTPRLEYFVVYQGRILEQKPVPLVSSIPPGSPKVPRPAPSTTSQNISTEQHQTSSSIVERAQEDALRHSSSRLQRSGYAPAYSHGPRRLGQYKQGHSHSPKKGQLIQQMTSDYEGSSNDDLPDPPDWVKKGARYACERSTPADSPNVEFIEQLKKIRLVRILTDDEIGVRAYSTSIAALAAYPHKITQGREILQLPGCDVKIANLWIEWKNNARVAIVEEADNDEAMKVLRDFYEIWGVGATTAREFYFDRGWRDRDDIVEYGWQTLTRVQQIGVKYYDEFLQGIPRTEVEQIAAIVKEHAVRVRDTGIELLVVGGYRRGKDYSGDVDIIVSHRDFDKTANLVTDIVASLEAEDWITHTLLLSLNGTERGQATLPFKGPGHGGHGFDTLDKALVVWQDPHWLGRAKDNKRQNPNPHRRVDIIISPWRTVGCAVTGWSGGTTFQRDLRRYAKNKWGWKFDSSGVRSRRTGLVVDLEGPEGVEGSMIDAEKAVFKGMGLEYRQPRERCTY